MRRHPTRRTAPGRGFTLIELLIVMVIIGIIIAFILNAAMAGVRRAEERATQALISKLETGLNDRVEALLSTRADANPAHAYMAAIWTGATTYIPDRPNSIIPAGIPRAQVIAQFDRLKAELPDVFVINGPTTGPDPHYPINFAGVPYTFGNAVYTAGNLTAAYATYLLPVGIGMLNDPTVPSWGGTSPLGSFPESTGIFGASYAAAGGLYKQLGAAAPGYDGTDNDGDGLIDDLKEGGLTLASPSVQQFLANHTHKTARAEMLYAVLVEGIGPLGSVFNRDDFSDSEVKDTDGDGLMEFVDAWGEPLQFYRWPIFYYGNDPNHTDIQRGWLPYGGPTAPRDQDTLDPNQQLVAPAWWSNTFNGANGSPYGASAPLSGGALVFQSFFHSIVDPYSNPAVGAVPLGSLWDRGSVFSQRRAYYSKVLILSGGPDRVPGAMRLDTDYYNKLEDYASQYAGYTSGSIAAAAPGFPTNNLTTNVQLLLIEDQAASTTWSRSSPNVYMTPLSKISAPNVHSAMESAISDVGADDITNQNLQSPGGVIQ
jgi:prepilin-type N-terminal cleavage/methylation domain-containing protein